MSTPTRRRPVPHLLIPIIALVIGVCAVSIGFYFDPLSTLVGIVIGVIVSALIALPVVAVTRRRLQR